MIRVLVVDDHPVVRHGLSAILSYEPGIVVVGAAADGAEAVRLILAERPEVVLLDLHLPQLSGVEVMRQARGGGSQARFLILTTYDTDEYLAPAMAAGAQGYLLKDAAPEDLVRGVRALAEGGAALEPGIAARLLGRLQGNERDQHLSPRELEVLRLLAQGANNKGIAAALLVSEGTVKTYLSRIFDKLEVQNRAEAVAVGLRRRLITHDGPGGA